jgi:hypothetical protein
VSHREGDHRGLIGQVGTEAQLDGLAVAPDGNATQHHRFQVDDGHCRPPTIKERQDNGGPGHAGRPCLLLVGEKPVRYLSQAGEFQNFQQPLYN